MPKATKIKAVFVDSRRKLLINILLLTSGFEQPCCFILLALTIAGLFIVLSFRICKKQTFWHYG